MRNDQNNYRKEYSTGMTEVVTKGDSRENVFDDAKRKELNALAERGTSHNISKSDVPQKMQIFLKEDFY